jgi:hypothetical protein
MADPRYLVVMIGGVPVVDTPQEIHAANAESFRKALLHAADRAHAAPVVNMTATPPCAPPGVAALAWAHGYAVAKGGDLLLVTRPAPPCSRLRPRRHRPPHPRLRDPERGTQARPCCCSPAPAPACCRCPASLAHQMPNPSGSRRGRFQADRQPSARQ